MQPTNLIRIDNTRFIYITNFSGDPERDRFGSDARKASLVIPDPEQALAMLRDGFNVKSTKPREGEEDDFIPTYFVDIKVNLDTAWPPKICLVTGDADPVSLDEDSIGILDKCRVRNVNVILNPYQNKKTGRKSLYVRTMYVEQNIDDDPYAAQYGSSNDDCPF